jgi:hypothetical protein
MKYGKIQNLRLIPLPKVIENYILVKDAVGEIYNLLACYIIYHTLGHCLW